MAIESFVQESDGLSDQCCDALVVAAMPQVEGMNPEKWQSIASGEIPELGYYAMQAANWLLNQQQADGIRA